MRSSLLTVGCLVAYAAAAALVGDVDVGAIGWSWG